MTACNEDCQAPFQTNCGVGACTSDTWACVTNVALMVFNAFEAVLSTALLIMTFGASAALKIAATAAQKAALRAAARKNMGRVFKRASKAEFKNMWAKLALENVKAKLKSGLVYGKLVAYFMAKQAKDSWISAWSTKAKELAAQEMVADHIEGKTMSMIEAAQKQLGENDNSSFVEKVDPTGLAALINEISKQSDNKMDLTKKWLDLFGTFDPTGWIAVASNFIKPICEDQIEKARKESLDGGKNTANARKGGGGGGAGGSSSGGRRGR